MDAPIDSRNQPLRKDPKNWNRLSGWATSCLLAGVSCLNGSTLVADPIEPWQGGRAEVQVFDQKQSQSGSIANVRQNGTTIMHYIQGIDQWSTTGNICSHEAKAGASAQVFGAANNLLQIDASYEFQPGYRRLHREYEDNTPNFASAQASWSGDRIHVQPGVNGSLPDSIRVGVAVTLAEPSNWTNPLNRLAGQLAVQVGDRSIALAPWPGLNEYIPQWLVDSGFDSANFLRTPSSGLSAQGKIFLDLALDAQGWSDPFDLKLWALSDVFGGDNYYYRASVVATGEVTLGIEDITLSDGTSLTDADYGVTFDSGLAWPVPEPASMVSWAVAAGVVGAGGMFRRRKRTRSAGAIV